MIRSASHVHFDYYSLLLLGLLWALSGLGHGSHSLDNKDVEVKYAFLHLERDAPIERILTLSDSQWKAVHTLGNFGFQSDDYWIRLIVSNISDAPLYRIARFEYMAHDRVAIYQVGDQGEVKNHWLLGDHVKGIQRPVEDKHPAFPVTLQPRESQTYYIRINSFNALILGIEILDLNEHSRIQQVGLLLAGVIYGILLVMALYNFGLAVFIKDKAYAVYVVYVLSFLLFVLVITNDGYYFLWSQSPTFHAYALPYSAAWLIIPCLLFPYYLLDLKQHFMFAARLIRATNIVVVLFILCLPFLGLEVSITVINVLSAFIALAVLCMGIYLTYLRVPIAGIYTLAWFILLVGLTILPLSSLGFIDNNLFTRNANIIGGVIETIILSLALAQRVRQERSDKLSAVQSTLEAKGEAEKHKKLFDALFTKSPVGIFQANEKGEILAVNPALLKLLGYQSEDEVKAKYLDVYRQFEGAGKLGGTIFKRGEILDYETRFRPNNGDAIDCSVTLRADQIGDEKMVEGYITDISERKNAQKIHELMERERIDSIDHLVSGVAHEINTPLGNNITSISHVKELLMEVQGAMEQEQLSRRDFEVFIEDSGKLMSIMEGNLQRISSLISRFRQLSISKMDIEVTPIVMYEHLHEIMSSQFQLDSTVQSQIQCERECLLATYPAAWQMIIDQLVENSVMHGFSNGQTDKAIFIQLKSLEHSQWEFVYSDNGQGMDQATVDKVFEPFFTTKRSNQKNAGLGLYRIYNLVTQVLKGEVNIQSDVGFKLIIQFKAERL